MESPQISVRFRMFLECLDGIVLISAVSVLTTHLLSPSYSWDISSAFSCCESRVFCCFGFALVFLQLSDWIHTRGKSFKSETFSSLKRSFLFLFLSPFPSGAIWFWKLGNFSPFRFGNLEKVKKWKLVQKRFRALNENSLVFHKSRLILKEKSPCVSLFN